MFGNVRDSVERVSKHWCDCSMTDKRFEAKEMNFRIVHFWEYGSGQSASLPVSQASTASLLLSQFITVLFPPCVRNSYLCRAPAIVYWLEVAAEYRCEQNTKLRHRYAIRYDRLRTPAINIAVRRLGELYAAAAELFAAAAAPVAELRHHWIISTAPWKTVNQTYSITMIHMILHYYITM